MLKVILRCFELFFGLKINLWKSMMVGVGSSDEEILVLGSKFHCKARRLPIIYLGLRIGVKMSSKSVEDTVVENFESNLT